MSARTRASAVLAIALVAAALGTGAPVEALQAELVEIPDRSVVEVEFDAIPASDPASVTVGGVVGPEECAALPSCMLVPLQIENPTDVKAGDDFYVILDVSWEYASGAEDLDVFLFDNGQTAEAEGSSGYTEVGSSAGSDNPESVRSYEPKLGEYNLVIQNFSGLAVVPRLRAESIVGVFVPPNESLAMPTGGGTRSTTTTVPRSTTSVPAAQVTSTTATIPEGVVLPDDDFDGDQFAAEEDQLAALEEARNAAAELRPRELASPSAITLILSMVVAPAALVGLIALAIRFSRRRRRGAAAAVS